MSRISPRNISKTSSTRAWSLAMTAFLLRHRREGRTVRWIARALGMPFEQVRKKAVGLGLVLRTAYLVRVPSIRLEDEPTPVGANRELLADDRCRWIAGDVMDPDWRMCGHPIVRGSSWCAHHHARVVWFEPSQQKEAA